MIIKDQKTFQNVNFNTKKSLLINAYSNWYRCNTTERIRTHQRVQAHRHHVRAAQT